MISLASQLNLKILRCRYKDLPSLDYLSLSGNKLSELPSSLEGLKSLKGLYLRQNRFTEVPKALIDLEQILDFDLSDNPLEKLPLWSILINGFKHNTSLDLVSDYSTFTKRFPSPELMR